MSKKIILLGLLSSFIHALFFTSAFAKFEVRSYGPVIEKLTSLISLPNGGSADETSGESVCYALDIDSHEVPKFKPIIQRLGMPSSVTPEGALSAEVSELIDALLLMDPLRRKNKVDTIFQIKNLKEEFRKAAMKKRADLIELILSQVSHVGDLNVRTLTLDVVKQVALQSIERMTETFGSPIYEDAVRVSSLKAIDKMKSSIEGFEVHFKSALGVDLEQLIVETIRADFSLRTDCDRSILYMRGFNKY